MKKKISKICAVLLIIALGSMGDRLAPFQYDDLLQTGRPEKREKEMV